jgi:hypothetical protein
MCRAGFGRDFGPVVRQTTKGVHISCARGDRSDRKTRKKT